MLWCLTINFEKFIRMIPFTGVIDWHGHGTTNGTTNGTNAAASSLGFNWHVVVVKASPGATRE
jgi:hypothetical protein